MNGSSLITLTDRQAFISWATVSAGFFAVSGYWLSNVQSFEYDELSSYHVKYLVSFLFYFFFSALIFKNLWNNSRGGVLISILLFGMLLNFPTVTSVHFWTQDHEITNYFHGEKFASTSHGVRFTPFAISLYRAFEYIADNSIARKLASSNIVIVHIFSIAINLMLWVSACLLLRLSKKK